MGAMAGCVANVRSAAGSSIQPCLSVGLSCSVRNAPAGAYLYNPLGCNRRSSRLLSAKITVRAFDLLSKRRWIAPLCALSSNSAQEPVQLSIEVEEERVDGNEEEVNAENPSTSAIDFASSLVSAVSADSSAEIGRVEKKKRNRKGEREAYLLAAIASSIGFTAASIGAVYYRFYLQMQVCISLDSTVQCFSKAFCEERNEVLEGHNVPKAVYSDC